MTSEPSRARDTKATPEAPMAPDLLPEPAGGKKPSPEVRRPWAFIPKQGGLKIRLQRQLPGSTPLKAAQPLMFVLLD